jgi:hypothetical protein
MDRKKRIVVLNTDYDQLTVNLFGEIERMEFNRLTPKEMRSALHER